MYAYLLSGENKKLSVLELLALSRQSTFILDKRLVLLKTALDFKRLCYTKKAYRVLGIFSYNDNLEEKIDEIDLNKYYKKNFSVRRISLTKNKNVLSERELSSVIWRKLKKPSVDLKNPVTRFEFVYTDNKIYLLLVLYKQDKKNMLYRWPQNRPAFHPTTMTPLFALMLVNLAGAKKGDVVLDPFCGVGGILIEAGLIGCRVVGCDKDNKMIRRAKENLEYFKIKDYKLIEGDALDLKTKADFIITDIPYGRHSKLFGKKTNNLASRFLGVACRILNDKGKIVIVCPHNMELDFYCFRILDYVDYYIHSSLTRRIYILEKSKQWREYKVKQSRYKRPQIYKYKR